MFKLIDDIFWHMYPSHAEKVIMFIIQIIPILAIILNICITPIILIISIIHIITIILIILTFQVRIALGIADHVWQNKRLAIAQEVDNLGPGFRPAMRDAWLKYIQAAYAAEPGEQASGPSIGQGRVVVEENNWGRIP